MSEKISPELQAELEKAKLVAIQKIRIMVELFALPTRAQLGTFTVDYEARIVYKSKVKPYVSMIVATDKVQQIASLPWVKKVWHVPVAYPIEAIIGPIPLPVPKPEAWSTISLLESTEHIKANYAKHAGYTGKNVIVAVLDTGIQKDHLMLAGKVIAEKNFISPPRDAGDRNGHGSWVASCIAGKPWATREGLLEGVAPDASIINAKIFEDSRGEPVDVGAMPALEWVCERGADICSNSWGIAMWYEPLRELIIALKAAYATIFVFAGGNDGPAPETMVYPGGFPEAVGVGAIAVKSPSPDAVASFSSRGPNAQGDIKPDICAPGGSELESIIGAWIDVGYLDVRGTSMATPHIAGALALMLEAGLTKEQAVSTLYTSARDIMATGRDNDSGYGVADVAATLNLPPPPNYVLTVDCNVAGVPFTVKRVDAVTPWSGELPSGRFMVIFPLSTVVDGQAYNFRCWSDGVVEAGRIIQLSAEVALTALYDEAVSISPSDDTFCRSASPESIVGSSPVLSVGISLYEEDVRRAFVKFDLREIPVGAKISSAILRLHHTGWEGHDPEVLSVEVREVADDSWVESELNWNNQPTFGTLIAKLLGKKYGLWELDITGYVKKEFLTDRIVSICLKSIDETWRASHKFHSKESDIIGARPTLVVSYYVGPIHRLAVNSTPIKEVPVSIGGELVGNTPVSVNAEEGEHIIIVPNEVIVE